LVGFGGYGSFGVDDFVVAGTIGVGGTVDLLFVLE
jgi:hypothetical protein